MCIRDSLRVAGEDDLDDVGRALEGERGDFLELALAHLILA